MVAFPSHRAGASVSHAAVVDALLTDVRRLHFIMSQVATGAARIQDLECEYVELRSGVARRLNDLGAEGLELQDPNPYWSLWEWYRYWREHLSTYAARREHVSALYGPLIGSLQAASTNVRRVGDGTFAALFDDLHPLIVRRSRVAFDTGEYDTAVFNAFKAVEERLRSRIGGSPTDIGVGLVSKALSPKAAMLTFSAVDAEQEAAHHLYRGAIGVFKNPHSHRFVDSHDPRRTFEALALASLLLRLLGDMADAAPSAN